MTILGDEEAAQKVIDFIQEEIDNMTEEDWEKAFDNLRKNINGD